MPETGQRIGRKDRYTYVADDGQKFALKLDITLATAGAQGLVPTTTADGATNKPTNFTPRGVHWQADIAGQAPIRKFLVCNADAALYTAVTQTTVTIDELEGYTTGRRGEKLTY